MSESKQAGVLRFRCAGVPVAIQPSFWLVTLFIGARGGRDPQLIAVWVAVVLVSVLVHELGHALAARLFGATPRIELHGMGGTTYRTSAAPLPTGRDVLVYLAGPCAGLALGALVFAARVLAAPWWDAELARTLFADLLWVNWGYGLVNFLPILPLDGGHVMHALIERVRGQPSARAAALVSLATALALALLAIAWRAAWALFLLGWLALSHARTLVAWWHERRDAARASELDAVDADVARGDLAAARARAEALLSRLRSDQARARVLCRLADIHLRLDEPGRAADRLEQLPASFGPPASLLVPLVQGLLARGDLDGAQRVALARPQTLGRAGLAAVAEKLFYAERFAESLALSELAFAQFADATDAYNAACAETRRGRLDAALGWLRRAVGAGWSDGAHLDGDPDLAPLRACPEYAAVRAAVASGPSTR